MRIIATPLTSGNATPGKEQPGGYYRFRGRPGWPEDPATRDDKGGIEGPIGGAKVRAEERIKRTVQYAQLRDQGATHEEAQKQIKVAKKTGARYRAEWLAIPCGHDYADDCARCRERREAESRPRRKAAA